MTALLIGAVLGSFALAFVLWPLFAARKSENEARAETPRRVPDVQAAERAEAMIQAARGAVVTCAHCSAVCPEPGARFCSSCGEAVRS